MKSLKANSAAHKFTFILIALFSVSCLKLCAESAAMPPEKAKEARLKFVEEAQKLLGCPYVYGAVGPDRFDCSGYVYYTAREVLKIQLPRTARAIYTFADPVTDENREPGDLVFFKTTSSGHISHVGIYIGEDNFISALSDGPNRGVVVSSLKSSYWKPRYSGAARILPSGKLQEKLEQFEDSEEYDVDGLLETINKIEEEYKVAESEKNTLEKASDKGNAASNGIIDIIIEEVVFPETNIRKPLEKKELPSYDEIVSNVETVIKEEEIS